MQNPEAGWTGAVSKYDCTCGLDAAFMALDGGGHVREWLEKSDEEASRG